MASDKDTFVIVGAALAGAKAAETLRDVGFAGRVVLVGEEKVRPYERPPLSKSYLRGEEDFDGAAVHDAGYYEENGIEWRSGEVAAELALTSNEVVLGSGERVHFDRLLLTTGAAPRRMAVPGAELAGIHTLRTVSDSDQIRAAISSGVPVVVVGASFIGAEVAASARQLGAEVTMIDPMSMPLERALGSEVGAVYRDLHEEHGVALRLGGAGVESFGGSGRVEEVRLSDGSVLPAGAVITGIGVLPNAELAARAGLEVDNGVVTDAFLATSAPGVYAAGDVANTWHPLYEAHIRLEHWSAALNQGPAAARNMLGRAVPYEKTPYFYSDQYDLGMEYRGWAPHFDQVVFRGDVAGRAFVAFWLENGVVAAAMNANVWDVGDALEALVRARPTVDPALLADPDADLLALAGVPEGSAPGD